MKLNVNEKQNIFKKIKAKMVGKNIKRLLNKTFISKFNASKYTLTHMM